MDGEIGINLGIFVILIAATAFFVSTEFAIVKVRTTRIDQLIAEGNKQAIKAKQVVTNLDEYLSACQLGITITALGLGWIGEPTAEKLLHPIFEWLHIDGSLATILSFVISFGLVTYVHVVIGELAPKTLAIQKAEWVTLKFAAPIMVFYKTMYPFIKLLNGSARLIGKMFGLKMMSEGDEVHSEEELRMIMTDSLKGGEINSSEYNYVNRIFEFDDRVAKEIMVPRTEIVSFDKDLTIREVFHLMREEQYTRYPVYDGDKDHIIGVVNMKTLLTEMIKDDFTGDRKVIDYVQPIIQVIETLPISDLLLKFQLKRIHMAVLLDEYGGTSGLVTIEDVIEEIVGEIRDEFDTDEKPELMKVAEGHYNVSGKYLLEDVNDILGIELDEENVDTIGGWFMAHTDELKTYVSIENTGYRFTAIEVNNHQIVRMDIQKLPEQQNDFAAESVEV